MQNISGSQASPEIPINENFTLLACFQVYGMRAPTTSGLTWGYWGGRWGGIAITDGTLTLTASTTKDRYSARQANVSGGTQRPLFWLSVLLLVLCLGTEVTLLVLGLPVCTSELVVGRVLGLLDAIAMTVLAYWYGTSSSSAIKTQLLIEK